MQIHYDKLLLPQHVAGLVREIVDGKVVGSMPANWEGIIVYHPSTRTYYSTKSGKPLEYEETMRTKEEPRYSKLAIALRNLLNIHPTYQFFFMQVRVRTDIENWLKSHGIRRVATQMGEAQTVPHVLWQVHSRINNFTRYVSAERGATASDVIDKANKSVNLWLKSTAAINSNERKQMRVALQGRVGDNQKVFEESSAVSVTHLFNQQPVAKQRAIVTEENITEIKTFIHNTQRGTQPRLIA